MMEDNHVRADRKVTLERDPGAIKMPGTEEIRWLPETQAERDDAAIQAPGSPVPQAALAVEAARNRSRSVLRLP